MSLDRRKFVGRSVVAGAGVAFAGAGAPVAEAAESGGRGAGRGRRRHAFSVMGTTDLHGNVFNWDYVTDAEFDDAAHNDIGLAKVSTLVESVRREKGRHNTLLIDAGDTIQGTQLAYYYAKVEPITGPDAPVHPMARAMNAIGYDAAALGNHEFNYGIPVLRKFEESCDFPLLGANAVDAKTLRPAFPPYVIKRLRTPCGRDVRVAVLGLTNPGIAIWDKAHVQGKLAFPGLVEQAAEWVPKLRSMGADVVIVSAHSGTSGTSSYGDQLPYVENAAVSGRRGGAGDRRDFGGARACGDSGASGGEQGDGPGGGAVRAAEVGAAVDGVRCGGGVAPGAVAGGVGGVEGAECECGRGGFPDHHSAAGRAEEGGGVCQPGDRAVEGGDDGGGGAGEGHARFWISSRSCRRKWCGRRSPVPRTRLCRCCRRRRVSRGRRRCRPGR